MKKKIIIFGAGQGCKELLFNLDRNKYEPLFVIDSDKAKLDQEILGTKIINDSNEISLKNVYAICSVRDIVLRNKIYENEIKNKFDLTSIIDSSVQVPNDLTLGKGVIIYPKVTLSYDVTIRDNVTVNYNTLLGHNLIVGKNTFIGPGVTIPGRCQIGNNCVIGAGSTFMEGVNVCDDSIIGVGTTVLTNINNPSMVMDMPRKLVKKLDEK